MRNQSEHFLANLPAFTFYAERINHLRSISPIDDRRALLPVPGACETHLLVVSYKTPYLKDSRACRVGRPRTRSNRPPSPFRIHTSTMSKSIIGKPIVRKLFSSSQVGVVVSAGRMTKAVKVRIAGQEWNKKFRKVRSHCVFPARIVSRSYRF